MKTVTTFEMNGQHWSLLACYDCNGTGFAEPTGRGKFYRRRECPACKGFGMHRFLAKNQPTTEARYGKGN